MKQLYLILIAGVGLLGTAGAFLGSGGSLAPAPAAPSSFTFLLSDGKAVAEGRGEDSIGTDIGQFAPNFELNELGGKTLKLSDFRGHFVLINFWTSWCPICRQEMSELDKFHRAHPEIVLWGLDIMESEEAIRAFLKVIPVSYPILRDADGKTLVLFRLTQQPATFLINQQGVIVWKKFGATSERELAKQVQKLGER